MNDNDIEIPGAPSEAAIRAELVRTGGVEYWKPLGTAEEGNGYNGQPTDFSTVSPEAKNKILSARLQLGPGPTGTPYQHALWQHQRRLAALESERDSIYERMSAVTYDPDTGEGISKASEDETKANSYRLSQVLAEIKLHEGAAGELKLQRALEKAVQSEKARYRREYVQAEAKRRAAADTLEGEIERAVAGYRKTQPR